MFYFIKLRIRKEEPNCENSVFSLLFNWQKEPKWKNLWNLGLKGHKSVIQWCERSKRMVFKLKCGV